MPGMLAEMRRCFERIEDGVPGRGLNLADCLMSGLAVFSLKYPSLLRFEQDARGLGDGSDGTRRENLRNLFGIERAPSDVRLRERLDELDPAELRRPYKRLFALAQRGGGSEGLRVAGRSAPAVGGRHGALLVADGALRELLREGARGRRPGSTTISRCARCWRIRSAGRFCRRCRRSRSRGGTGRRRTTASGTRRSVC